MMAMEIVKWILLFLNRCGKSSHRAVTATSNVANCEKKIQKMFETDGDKEILSQELIIQGKGVPFTSMDFTYTSCLTGEIFNIQ